MPAAAAALAIASVVGTQAALASGWAAGPATTHAVPLERTALGVWTVTAALNGRVRGRFLLDTGATWCALTPRTAARLRLSQAGERVQMQTAAGLVPMPLVRIQSIEVGGRRARSVQAVILPDDLGDFDGVIGMNFLNEFAYSIDPRRAVLRLD